MKNKRKHPNEKVVAVLKEVPLASLVEDFSLYPRNRVDDVHVSDLVRAIASGDVLPPIIIDAETLRIADGFHRGRAYRKALGEDAMVTVEMRRYPNEAALFLDAVSLNASHGRKLDRQDQTRIVLKLRELGVEDKQIAIRLHIPEAELKPLALRVHTTSSGDTIPSKRGLAWKHGEVLTSEQVKALGSVRSAEITRLCMELTRLIDSGLVDLSDPQVIQWLRATKQSIESSLHAVAA